MSQSAKCNRCQQDGLGWCVSRSSGKHYLAYLVSTPVVAPDGVTIVHELKPQPNLLHQCGKNWTGKVPQTIEDARQSAATYAAERARLRALAQSPQPIAAPIATAAPVAAKSTRKGKAPAAAVAPVSAPVNAQVLPFKTDGAVSMTPVNGKLETQVVMTRALVSKGFDAVIAETLAKSATPAQLAALLLS